jgi:large conductance mechanosensitive channel
MWREFKAFILKENILSLALAVVIGGALAKVVAALVADFIMPIVTFAVPGGDWRSWTANAGPVKFGIGDFLGVLLDFLIIGFVVWRISKVFIKPSPTTPVQNCPFCKLSVDLTATRCPHCTSQLAVKI